MCVEILSMLSLPTHLDGFPNLVLYVNVALELKVIMDMTYESLVFLIFFIHYRFLGNTEGESGF